MNHLSKNGKVRDNRSVTIAEFSFYEPEPEALHAMSSCSTAVQLQVVCTVDGQNPARPKPREWR